MYTIFKIIKGHKAKIGFLIFLILLSSFTAIFPVKIIQKTVDLIPNKGNNTIQEILFWGILFLLFHVVSGISSSILEYKIKHFENEIGHNIRLTLFDKIMEMKYSYFTKKNTSSYLTSLIEDSHVATSGFLKPFLYIVRNFFSFIFGIYFMLQISLELTFLTLAIGLLASYITKISGKKLTLLAEKNRENKSDLWFVFSESLKSIKEIKANLISEKVKKMIGIESSKYNNSLNSEAKFHEELNAINTSIFMFVIGSIMTIGAILTLKGKITIGGFMAIMMYNSLTVDPILESIILYKDIKKINVAFNKINQIFNCPSIEPKLIFKTKNNFNIDIKNTSFSFNPSKIVLKDINLKINLGEKVAIIGRSGSGKSTLINLLTGFLEPNKGSLYLGNIKILGKNINYIREKISVVFQETILFDMSLKDNLKFFNEDIYEEEIIKILKICELDKFSDKLKISVEEGGRSLSGGERKRVQIAKILARNTPIIIFDEITSSLDNKTAHKIVKNIIKAYPTKTLIFIEHRLDVVKSLKKHILKNGIIVETGYHEELLSRKGEYHSLFVTEKNL